MKNPGAFQPVPRNSIPSRIGPTLAALACLFACCESNRAAPATAQSSKSTYTESYGKTRNAVVVDVERELPHYPPVEPAKAIATWKVKPGFRLDLAAHEPQVRDPIALCFDERGRMFVCEMIDYSEMRETSPHLGRISVLEDRDHDGSFESSRVFADNLPWPTGLIWARGGLYVAATPDIWRFEDRDGDGTAEVREKAFTGFGTGLQRLNVQSMLNSLQWGQDNRIHVLAGGGNRGLITCPRRPEQTGIELGGRDFWFDPLTHEFGLEPGGAQYGMSFDNYGRRFGCSNSDHLQYWVYDDDPGWSGLPPARQSIAADGGAAEVFRISPDEPWRILRTRWRISGTVPGMVEGGGRVSGYFTGATGTTIYRGDALGPEFLNNSFTGDAGGQLVHRKVIRMAADGVNLEGRRPADEQDFEFAASTDTWVRVVNFANAPDGCLYFCDMYREIIEHPWSIPEEIKQHLDLNHGNDRGRVWRIAPQSGGPRIGRPSRLDQASVPELVALLSHPNGWHRDTAQRLLHERRDPSCIPGLESMVIGATNELARIHAFHLLSGLGVVSSPVMESAIADSSVHLREKAMRWILAPGRPTNLPDSIETKLARFATDGEPRLQFQLALALGNWLERGNSPRLESAWLSLARHRHPHPWIGPALLRAPARVLSKHLFPPLASDEAFRPSGTTFLERLIETLAASDPATHPMLLEFVARRSPNPSFVQALGKGVQRRGNTLSSVDPQGQLNSLFETVAKRTRDPASEPAARVEGIETLSFAPLSQSRDTLRASLHTHQPVSVQSAAMKALLRYPSTDATDLALSLWPDSSASARENLLDAFLQRPDRTTRLLAALESGEVKGSSLGIARIQSLIQHRDPAIASRAKAALLDFLPPSRDQVLKSFHTAISLKGDARKGRETFLSRCANCHRAASDGSPVGPDLISTKSRGREGLLTAIVDPQREVAAQFILYHVNTKGGDSHSGIISEDTATAVTLKMAANLTQTIPRTRIQGVSSDGQSLMPEGLESGLSVQDMADLLTFIEELK